MSNNKNPFADFTNLFSNNPFAGNLGWDEVVSAGRLNAQAFSDATKVAIAGGEALSRLQTQNAQQFANDASKFIKEATASTKNPEANIARQAEFTQKTIESAISNSKECFEMVAKSSEETANIINKRVSTVISELSAGANKKKKSDAA